MKRILAIGLVLLLLLSMAGCAAKNEKKAAAADVVASDEPQEKAPTIVENPREPEKTEPTENKKAEG